jgi:oligopeptide/dipeptide ABC transporter ATP-binding protein
MRPLLEVRDLHVSYRLKTGEDCRALAGVNFEVQAGETLGVLGESGSGKSTLAAALLRLLPPNGEIQKGEVRFEGQDLLHAEPRELEKIRGSRIGLIFQEPSMALHPAIRVGDQIRDVMAAHEPLGRRASKEKTLEILKMLFSADAHRISNSYAHQLSGGQRQRILMAQAIACDPSLIIADEPTASLDPSTQQEILELFQTLREKLKLALIFITHNPSVLARLADRILVLYAGRVAEVGPTERMLTSPQHPYAQALMRCLPRPIKEASSGKKNKLPVIAGESPNLSRTVAGCNFEPRCPDRMDVCTAAEPAETFVGNDHSVSCFKYRG